MIKIDSKLSYYKAMVELEILLLKGISNHTEAEELRLDELTDAIEAWEKIEYPMPLDDINYRQEFYKIAEKHCDHVIKLIAQGKSTFCRFTLMSMLCDAGDEFIKEFINNKNETREDIH